MVLVKNWRITSSLFLALINLKILSPDILDRKKGLGLDYKCFRKLNVC